MLWQKRHKVQLSVPVKVNRVPSTALHSSAYWRLKTAVARAQKDVKTRKRDYHQIQPGVLVEVSRSRQAERQQRPVVLKGAVAVTKKDGCTACRISKSVTVKVAPESG